MKLEPIEKLADDDLVEVLIGRLVHDDGALLVTVRRLHRQVTELPGLVDNLRRASEAAQHHHNAHLVRHLGLTEAGGSLCWVSERPVGFDLGTVFKRMSSREVHLAPLRALRMGLDLLAGLGVLHEHGDIHGGLGPLDVLVGYDGTTRLDGAGFSHALLSAKELKQKARRGRAAHLAPEVVQGRDPTVQSDVYAAAAILYNMLTGVAPVETDEQGGTGISVRHNAVQPPSKLDRSLPYSCDAVFIKALNTSARNRHESVASLTNAVSRLRAAMLKGPDEGQAGVAEFVRGLFPNEALVAGQPGTLERPAVADGAEVEGLVLPTGGPEVDEDEDTPPDGAMQMDEDTPPDGTVPSPAPNRSATGQDGEADEEALARIRAWESLHGGVEEPEPPSKPPPLGRGRAAGKPGPPPVPTRQTEAVPAGQAGAAQVEVPGDSAPEAAASGAGSSIVVDWDHLSEPPQVETVRDGKPLEKAKTPIVDRETLKPLNQPAPAPRAPAPPADAAKEKSDSYTPDGATQPDLRLEEVAEPVAAERPGWQRPVVMFMVGVLVAVVVLVVMMAAGVFSPQEKVEDAGAKTAATEVGFLTVRSDQQVKIVLDGEVLPATASLEHKIVRAGKHRLVVHTSEDQQLLDEVIVIEPGEKRHVRLVMTPRQASDKPPGELDGGQEDGAATGKGTRRKRKRRRRKRRSKRRTRRTR